MTPEELATKIDTGISSLETLDKQFGDQLTAKLADFGKAVELAKPAPAPAVKAEAEALAELEESGILKGIDSFTVWDIPVGQAVVGGFVAVFASELVDGFMVSQSNMTRGLVKLGVAGVSVKWGKKFLGDTGSKAVALLLAFDAIRDIVPIDTYAAKLSGMVSGKVTNRGLTQGGRTINVIAQANQAAADYYSRAEGR